MIGFGFILAALVTVGLIGRFHRPPAVAGLPEDPAVNAALTVIGGSLPVSSGDLRFESSLSPPGSGATPASRRGPRRMDPDRIAAAERWMLDARTRLPRDPRVDALLGHLELARHRYERAERRYRAALARAPRYPEARLGLGVSLALRAQIEGDIRRARRLTLEAIAQLAAVDPGDPLHLPALYDRTLLLARVGRVAEARRCAARYGELEPGSAWNASLMRRMTDAGQ